MVDERTDSYEAMADRTAVVTGAGSGIGAAVAERLAALGCQVALVGRTRAKLEAVAERIVRAGGAAEVIDADVSDVSALPALVSRVRKVYGGVDTVINGAAVLRIRAFADVTLEDFDELVAINLRGPFFVTQAFLEELRRAQPAFVVNLSSVAASIPRGGSVLYGTTKAALEYQTRCLAAELAPDGIRVNALAIGPVDTPIHDSWLPPDGEDREVLFTSVPLGRGGEAEEVAWWVTTLCGVQADWVTGAVIPVDGGKALGAGEPYVAK